MHRILIIGNGGAACHAVQAARGAGFTGEIHLVSDTREPAFNPMLAPYYLKKEIPWEQCYPFGADFYRRHDVTCHLGSPVVALDAVNREANTADGHTLEYDACLVASGASTSIPPVPGLSESAFAYPLRTAESMRHLESVLPTARKAVVMGASLVGMKMAEIMAKQKAGLIVVDVADQVMPRGAHPVTAGYLQQYFEQHGVEFWLGCSLQGLEESAGGVCCFFPHSIVDDADFIGVCTGIRPNLDFVDRDQVAVDMGIVIDTRCRSSVPGLYAAGDCAQGINPMTGNPEWLGTWANACYQGRTAGLTMAGRIAAFQGNIPQHVSPLFDWTYAQVGDVEARSDDVRIETRGNPLEGDGKFMLLVYAGDILVGANLINCMEHSAAVKQAIALKRPLSENLMDTMLRNWRTNSGGSGCGSIFS